MNYWNVKQSNLVTVSFKELPKLCCITQNWCKPQLIILYQLSQMTYLAFIVLNTITSIISIFLVKFLLISDNSITAISLKELKSFETNTFNKYDQQFHYLCLHTQAPIKYQEKAQIYEKEQKIVKCFFVFYRNLNDYFVFQVINQFEMKPNLPYGLSCFEWPCCSSGGRSSNRRAWAEWTAEAEVTTVSLLL